MDQFPIDIILLALIAGFVALRLRSVLGRRTGHEPGRDAGAGGDGALKPSPASPVEPEAPASLPPVDIAPDSALGKTLSRLQLVDRAFEPATFLAGAQRAYEMIIQAFAEGDEEALRPLVSREVMERFSAAIKERRNAGETVETKVVDVTSAKIVEAALSERTAEITVRFVSELLTVTRNAAGEIIAGNPSDTEKTIDLWTFARDIRDRDPNWTLVATAVGD